MSVRDRRDHHAMRRGWRWGAAAAAVVSLSACGSATGSGTAPPAAAPAPAGPASQVRSAGGGALCADAGAVDRLTVSRVNSIPANHPRFTFPATVTVTDAAQARTVARALCALGPARSHIACPADFGLTYRLDFTAAGRGLPPVTVRAGGCETVSGAGGIRWTMRSPAFWAVLGRAMGLANPGHQVFVGTMRP
jgi:hypothetical protein